MFQLLLASGSATSCRERLAENAHVACVLAREGRPHERYYPESSIVVWRFGAHSAVATSPATEILAHEGAFPFMLLRSRGCRSLRGRRIERGP